MSITRSTPKNLNLIKSSLHLRYISTECTLQTPPQQQTNDSIINQAVQLLQIPHNEWNLTHLNQLIFSDSSPSPRLLFQITRRLPSSSQALEFLRYLQHNSPPSLSNTQHFSSAFQAIFELASRERDGPGKNLHDLYKLSKEWNIPLTINSATLLLRCFGRAGLVEESVVLFDELGHKNTHVCNVMIGGLLKGGRFDYAVKVLDEMLQPEAESDSRPDDVTGDIVFSWLIRNENLGRVVSAEESVEVVLKLGGFGTFPNAFWLTQMIGKLCRNGKTNVAYDLLIELMTLGAAVEAIPCNALLTGLGRCSDFDKMNKVMAKMKEMEIKPNVVTFGILINHLCKFRRVDEALDVFRSMSEGKESDGFLIEPDAVIFNTLIDGHCKVGRQEEGLDLMQKMKLQGCAPTTVTYNCLIDGYCKAGEIERGLELFDEMHREGVVPNAITVNTLVDGMCKHGRTNSAVQFLEEMQSKGLKGNAFAFSSLINAFCNVNNIGKAMQIFDQMLIDGYTPDAMVYYNLIYGLTQARRMDDAVSILSKMKEAGFCPDVVCYNGLIAGFCNKNDLDKAHEMLNDMEEAGVKPDSITYNSLISYFGKIGDFKVAHKMMRKMTQEGLQPTVATYGSLIHSYCLSGNIDKAMKIFEDMNEDASRIAPNTVIYNILIDSLCKNNNVEYALSLMDDMRVKWVKPNTLTYNAIFKGLRERKWLKRAFELMDRMTAECCDPDYITMEILTEWLSDAGETEKLRSFARGYEFSASTAETGFSKGDHEI
ncbi:pentatricopeptide repeat-containing protein At3g61520, mitochondrial [Mercurialis annua]|uniref:pentatricopeptide repeat-containing protein At3g61520, mitochondrial n=1 Tax=Mercurialis annua TaxID=3986 RepID=UPI002160AA31|nr:pentatricopeptide repeat-containing protein At3g61520, mitochondrial [Mercurialis annua]